MYKQDIDRIEQVQRRFTSDYQTQHCRVLDLPTLELHVDLTWCYKIVFNVCLNFEDFFQYGPVSTMDSHHKSKSQIVY